MTETTTAPSANTPEARTPTGEIKDVTTPPTQTTQTETPTPTPTPTPTQTSSDSLKPGEKPPETLLTKKDGETQDKPAGAPEKYEDFKLPEGLALEGENLTKAQEVFKELNLSQDQAQKLVDFHGGVIKAVQDAITTSVTELRADWQRQSSEHPDLKGKLPEVKANLGRMFDAISALDPKDGPALVDDFKAAMDLTGAGDHPAFIRMVNRLAARWQEGKPVTGGNPSPLGQQRPDGGPRTAAQAMYPNLPSAASQS